MSLSTKDLPSPYSPTDSELVVLAQQGEDSAFEKLYERYRSRMRIYISRLVGNNEVGDELAQETFLRSWERLLQLRDPSRFASWLHRIATSIVRDYQRQERKFRWLPLGDYKTVERIEEIGLAGPEKQIEEREICEQALSYVSLNYRACLILYEVEGLSQREISIILGIKESSISKYISRGKEQFRQIYYQLIEEHTI